MADSFAELAHWLPDARAGSSEALGQVLEACRGYLLVIAQQELEPALQAKGGASDLVQQTFLEAQRDFAGFQGGTHEALLAWMRRLLLNNLGNFTRQFRAGKRNIGRELPIDGDDSRRQRRDDPGKGDSTPSAKVVRQEQADALQRALNELPDDYRQVVLLRYQDELAFEEIAQRMGRSANAVQKLWLRAIDRRGPVDPEQDA